jgi:3-oxoacyl-[acyl-carrier protein] reductase
MTTIPIPTQPFPDAVPLGLPRTGVAVITGASRGIGLAIATRMARRGLCCALLARTQSALNAATSLVADAVKGSSATTPTIIRGYVCDVSDEAAVASVSANILQELGIPAVVVNNAGVVERSPIEYTEASSFNHVMSANLGGCFYLTKAMLPAMRKQGRGRFVHIASISATLGSKGAASYCAAKWGTVGFMKSLAEEIRGSGLQTMAVLPGSVDTEMLKGSGFIPQMGPSDVAQLVEYLALDAPSAMNGSAVEIFG